MLRTATIRNIKYLFRTLLVVFGTIVVTGCGEEGTEKEPDVSDIKIELSTRRLDKDLGAIDTANVAPGLAQLKQKYPDFLDFYLDTLMGFQVKGNYSNDNPGIQQGLKPFLMHKDYRGVFDTVAKHYPDTKEVDEQLLKGFKNMKYYYPRFPVPKIVYLVSGLNNWGAFTVDSSIAGIGLDMFLGAQYPFYKAVGIPDYMHIQLQRDYIPVAMFRAVYQDIAPFVMENQTLLDMMIQRGKEMYFLKKIVPFVPEELRFGFTKKQLEWCEANEAQAYNFFITQNLLYETNWQKILRYVKEGPTSAGMPAESPGNIGTWIGYRIVNSYMAKNNKMTLQELLKLKEPSQSFLQQSGYKPR